MGATTRQVRLYFSNSRLVTRYSANLLHNTLIINFLTLRPLTHNTTLRYYRIRVLRNRYHVDSSLRDSIIISSSHDTALPPLYPLLPAHSALQSCGHTGTSPYPPCHSTPGAFSFTVAGTYWNVAIPPFPFYSSYIVCIYFFTLLAVTCTCQHQVPASLLTVVSVSSDKWTLYRLPKSSILIVWGNFLLGASSANMVTFASCQPVWVVLK